MEAIILDKHLLLRQATLEDAQMMFDRVDYNRAEIRKWMGWVDATKSSKDTAVFIQMTIDQAAADKGYQLLIMHDEEVIGVCGQHHINKANHAVSMGYWLCKDYQGRGIMARACEAIVKLAFNVQGLHRLEIRAAVDNEKSRAVAERLGFSFEGICRDGEFVNDHYKNIAVYALLKNEWLNGEAGAK